MRMVITVAANSLFAMFAALPGVASESIRPGQWQVVTTPQSISMPNMPAGLASAMKGRPVTVSFCLSAKDAAANPRTLFEASKGSCTYSKFELSGGRMESAATCKQPGGTMNINSKGRYTDTSYDIDSQLSGTGQMKISMTSKVTGKWIGTCKK
jgi:Protein of unknown function (DUF3617)